MFRFQRVAGFVGWFVPVTVATCLIGLSLVAGAGSAAAAGDPTLNSYIVSDPLPGTPHAPSAQIDTIVSQLGRVETGAVSPFGGAALVAGEGWQSAGSPRPDLLIFLVRFSVPATEASTADQQAIVAARIAGDTFCESASGGPPVSDVAAPSVPNSHHVVCPKGTTGVQAAAVTFPKANVLVVIETSTVSADRLDTIAERQYTALPAAAVNVSSRHAHTGVLIALVALVLLVALGVVAVLVVRSRHRASVATTAGPLPYRVAPSTSGWNPDAATYSGGAPAGPPPGWYPDPGGSGGRRYWTGTQWGPTEPSA